MLNKKAQIGETTTWIFATLVVIIILSLSIFLVQWTLKSRKFELNKQQDLIATKSLTGFLSTFQNGEKVYDKFAEQAKNKNYNLDENSGKLAVKIFKGFYNEIDYIIYFGINGGDNNYFEKPASWQSVSVNSVNPIALYYTSTKIDLENENYAEIYLNDLGKSER